MKLWKKFNIINQYIKKPQYLLPGAIRHDVLNFRELCTKVNFYFILT